jgi:hypothetical protein
MSGTRKAFLGVSRKSARLKLKPGSRSFWCVSRSSDAGLGDLIALYKTGLGVCQIYEIISAPETLVEWECDERSMMSVATELLVNVERPVSARDMKANPLLRSSGAVGRNFQMTTFFLRHEEWQELLNLISAKNPEMSGRWEELV